jgi:uncharacterized protein (TIGR02646 family)
VRPVERGPDPNPDRWSDWGAGAADALAGRMQWYCAYCEVALPTGPHVEHIQPRMHHPDLELEWTNWVLACTNCNSTKGHEDVPLASCLWPDRDNTFRAFLYGDAGVVGVNEELDAGTQALAEKLMNVVGLDRRPGHPSQRLSDRRWSRRRDAYDKAVRARARVRANPGDAGLRELAMMCAEATGFFSVWMAVFEDDPEMRRELIGHFDAAPECFDASADPILRPGGRC